MAKKKSQDKNEHVVIAFFPDQVAANHAADALKRWDDADDEIKLGAFGVLGMKDGKIKAHVGRKTGRGAGVGAVIGVIAGVLTGGVGLVGGLIAGGAAGGAVGAFMKDSLHMTKEEIEGLTPELSAGKVALVVTCDDFEIGPTQDQLNSLGGEVRNYVVPSKALAVAVEAGVGADWPTEPFDPEPTPVPELSAAAMPERTADVLDLSADEPEPAAADEPELAADMPERTAAVPELAAAAAMLELAEPDEPELAAADEPELSTTDIPELSATDVPERTAAVPIFTAAASETPAAPGPTTAFANDQTSDEANRRAEVF